MHRTDQGTPAHIAWMLPLDVLFFACGILLGRGLPAWQPAVGILVLSLTAAFLSARWLRSLSVSMPITLRCLPKACIPYRPQ